jgi:hypothetical protein
VTKDIRIGQRWRTRGGSPATIHARNDGRVYDAVTYPWVVRVYHMGTDFAGSTIAVTDNGRVYCPETLGEERQDRDDLVTLVEDVPAPETILSIGGQRIGPVTVRCDVLSKAAEGMTPVMDALAGIGDIASTEIGSGARYNAGKLPVELIPLSIIAETYMTVVEGDEAVNACHALAHLGVWQERGTDDGERNYLIDALQEMGLEGFEEAARVFDYGRRKYAEWNWAKGMSWTAVMACAARHLLKIIEGEQNDAESGLSHRGHFFCNVIMLLTYEFTYPEGDDRPAAGLLWREPQIDLSVEPSEGDDISDIAFERVPVDHTEGGGL